MNPRLRSILIVIGLLTVVIVAIILIPRGLSLYYQSRGGQQIEYVLRSVEGIQELVCEALPLSNQAAIGEVEQGIADLNRAVRLNRNNSQAYYYLGKATCLLGEPNEAVENYLQYTELRPYNPLGYIGLGFAYEQLGDFKSANSVWKSANVNPEEFINLGNEEFRAERYVNALNWYERSELMGGKQSAYSQFNWSVATILSGNQFPTQLDSLAIPVYQLSGDLKIEGDQLQWFRPEDNYWNIRYGQPLSEHPTGDPGVGGIWWEGAVVAILRIPCTTDYNINIRALHIVPTGEVGQMQFEENLTPFATFILEESWQEYSGNIQLTEGYHLVGMRVENIGDVLVDWMHITQESDCVDSLQ